VGGRAHVRALVFLALARALAEDGKKGFFGFIFDK
jgi:hypothetical protein